MILKKIAFSFVLLMHFSLQATQLSIPDIVAFNDLVKPFSQQYTPSALTPDQGKYIAENFKGDFSFPSDPSLYRTFFLPSGIEVKIQSPLLSLFVPLPTNAPFDVTDSTLSTDFQTFIWPTNQLSIDLRQNYGMECKSKFLTSLTELTLTFRNISPPLTISGGLYNMLLSSDPSTLNYDIIDLACSDETTSYGLKPKNISIRCLDPTNKGENYVLLLLKNNSFSLERGNETLIGGFQLTRDPMDFHTLTLP